MSSVVHGQFVSEVELGRGGLLVAPPPDGSRATFPRSVALEMFESSDAVEGHYEYAVFGLGVATLLPPSIPGGPSSPASPSAPSTSAPPAAASTASTSSSTTAPPTTTTTTTTTTTRPPSTSTTAAPASTTTSVPGPPPLPVYERRLAWVGIVFGGLCPPTASSGGKPVEDATEVAVLIDATNGRDVIAYTADAAAAGTSCDGPAAAAPALARPDELESVPWQPVGPASTAVEVTVPACGHYDGWTELDPSAAHPAVQVVASVPFDPLCGTTGAQVVSVDDVIPLGSSQQQVPHAPIGALHTLNVLPGGSHTAVAG